MKRTLFCFVFCLCTVICFSNDRLDERFRILYSDVLRCNFDKSLNLEVNETKVYFYNFDNDDNICCPIANTLDCITDFVRLDTSKNLVVFVPGYKCSIKRDIEESIRKTYKDVPNIYLMIIDHSAYTYENEEKLKSYSRSVLYSYYIGRALGKLFARFHRVGYSSRSFHCIGHSLGAHILGFAGDSYFDEISERLWKITGLDPAGPCFAKAATEVQLRSGNAEYVEVYHCNAGHLGTTNFIGDVDFFFNEHGKIQPDCEDGLGDEKLAKCYHKACVKYWTRSVHNSSLYTAVRCPSYGSLIEGRCTGNATTLAGHSNSGEAKGIFYISTKDDTSLV